MSTDREAARDGHLVQSRKEIVCETSLFLVMSLPQFTPAPSMSSAFDCRGVSADREAARDAQVLAGAAEAVDPSRWLHGAAARDAPVLQASCHGVEKCGKAWGEGSARV